MEPGGKVSFFVFYSASHEAKALEAHKKGLSLLATNMWCERLLEKHGVPFVSARPFVPAGDDLDPLLVQAETLAREWYRIPEIQFFTYKGIRLGEALEPMVDFYVQRFFYHFILLARFIASRSDIATLTVPYIEAENSETAGPLAPFEARVMVDAARAACGGQVTFEAVGIEPGLPKDVFPPKPAGLFWLSVYNFFVRLIPRKQVRIFASEYWSHIAPIFQHIRDTELVCMDRSEIKKAPLTKLLTYRMRFIHPLDIDTRRVRTHAALLQAEFAQPWQLAKEGLGHMPQFVCEGKSVWEALLPAFEYLVLKYAKRVIADIDGIEQILVRERINKVLLRASIGGRQHHFFLAAEIARRLGVPSFELQHANEIIDPRSIHSKLGTDYLFGYGRGTQEMVAKVNNISPDRIFPVGSPRFDGYAHTTFTEAERSAHMRNLNLDPLKPVLFVSMVTEETDLSFVAFDSYAIDKIMGSLQRISRELPDVQFIIKFRPGSLTEEYRAYMRDHMPEGRVYLASRENLFDLLLLSDAVLVGNSTVLYEAMIACRPIVLYPLRPHDAYFKVWFTPFISAPETTEELKNILARILADTAYREKLISATRSYVLEKCSFDGNSSARIAKLLEGDSRYS